MGTVAGVLALPRPARPVPRRLADLVGQLGLADPGGPPGSDPLVTGVSLDSRAVRPGDLYAALPGAHAHGARFAGEAVAAGARAVFTDAAGEPAARRTGVPVLVAADPRARLGEVCRAVYGDPGVQLLAVTGTNGKTTICYLLEAGLRAAGRVTGLVGTVETRIADDAVPSVRTTPEAPDLQALLAVMRERGVDTVAMEVSSHALALHRVDGLRFAVGAFTNLSQDHLDFHPGMEDYFQAKALLFDGRCDLEVVNVDDPYGRRLVGPATVTVSVAGEPHADWRALDVRPGTAGGSTFRVAGPHGVDLAAGVLLPGLFNVANALLALAVLAAAGVDPRCAVDGIARTTVPGRLESVAEGQPFAALVDYAHTPDALRTLLATLRTRTAGRLIVVVGCGGDRDHAKRALMGAAAARGADLAVLTDDNPRSEDPAEIRAAMLAGVCGVPAQLRGDVVEVAGRRAAIAAAVEAAQPGDTVVVAGKGHEQGQEMAGVVHPFDDRQVLRELIGAVLR